MSKKSQNNNAKAVGDNHPNEFGFPADAHAVIKGIAKRHGISVRAYVRQARFKALRESQGEIALELMEGKINIKQACMKLKAFRSRF